RSEGRREPDLPHRPLDGLPPAGARPGARPGAAQERRGRDAPLDARADERELRARPANARRRGRDPRLRCLRASIMRAHRYLAGTPDPVGRVQHAVLSRNPACCTRPTGAEAPTGLHEPPRTGYLPLVIPLRSVVLRPGRMRPLRYDFGGMILVSGA